MEFSQDITRILYDNCSFIADNFVDPKKKSLFNDINVHREDYEKLFRHFSCDLKFDHDCYFLARRSPSRQQLDSRLKDYYMWLEIIEFVFDVFGENVKPGFNFFQSELLTAIEGSVNLTRKLQALSVFVRENIKADGIADYVRYLIGYLMKKQVLDSYSWDQDENVIVYHLTSVFDYFKNFVTSVTLRKKEEENLDSENIN